jgi:hypothetical protein
MPRADFPTSKKIPGFPFGRRLCSEFHQRIHAAAWAGKSMAGRIT